MDYIDSTEVELDEKFIDFNFHTHLRHQGNKEHAKNYLKWETDLIKKWMKKKGDFLGNYFNIRSFYIIQISSFNP